MDDNRVVILLGGAVTAVSAVGLFFLPKIINLLVLRLTGEGIEWSLFYKLHLLGGIPGALVSGYLATDSFGYRRRDTSMKSGLYAALLGLVFVMIGHVLFNLYSTTVAGGGYPPPILVIVVTSLLVAMPMSVAYLVEGVLFGAFGGTIRDMSSEDA